jgi:hypothetical protein
LDSDGDKQISLNEVMKFVYKVWRSQLDDITLRLNSLDTRNIDEKRLSANYNRERQEIKEAIRKNFPRQWRDEMERETNGLHFVQGPFSALLKKLNIGSQNFDATASSPDPRKSPINNLFTQQSPQSPKPSAKRSRININSSGQNQVMRFKIKVPAANNPQRTGTKFSVPEPNILSDSVQLSGEVTKSILKNSY